MSVLSLGNPLGNSLALPRSETAIIAPPAVVVPRAVSVPIGHRAAVGPTLSGFSLDGTPTVAVPNGKAVSYVSFGKNIFSGSGGFSPVIDSHPDDVNNSVIYTDKIENGAILFTSNGNWRFDDVKNKRSLKFVRSTDSAGPRVIAYHEDKLFLTIGRTIEARTVSTNTRLWTFLYNTPSSQVILGATCTPCGRFYVAGLSYVAEINPINGDVIKAVSVQNASNNFQMVSTKNSVVVVSESNANARIFDLDLNSVINSVVSSSNGARVAVLPEGDILFSYRESNGTTQIERFSLTERLTLYSVLFSNTVRTLGFCYDDTNDQIFVSAIEFVNSNDTLARAIRLPLDLSYGSRTINMDVVSGVTRTAQVTNLGGTFSVNPINTTTITTVSKSTLFISALAFDTILQYRSFDD